MGKKFQAEGMSDTFFDNVFYDNEVAPRPRFTTSFPLLTQRVHPYTKPRPAALFLDEGLMTLPDFPRIYDFGLVLRSPRPPTCTTSKSPSVSRSVTQTWPHTALHASNPSSETS